MHAQHIVTVTVATGRIAQEIFSRETIALWPANRNAARGREEAAGGIQTSLSQKCSFSCGI